MVTVIIAAKSDNGVIGKDGDLPWNLPADLAFFRRQIEHCFLLSGRRSYESPQGQDIFEGRSDVIVLTRRQNYRPPSGLVAHSLADAFSLAKAAGAERLCILGGADIYRQAMAFTDELIITEVHTELAGDAFFPPIAPEQWEEVRREDYTADKANCHAYSFVFYRRRLV